MPIMSFQTWKSDTKRGLFTPRSSSLKNLDTAFETYERLKSRKTLIDLKTALVEWMKTKSDWRLSTRNKYGTVELLLSQLMDDLGPGMLPEARSVVLAPRPPLIARPPARLNIDGPRPVGFTETKMARVREGYGRLVGLVERCRDASVAIDRKPAEAARFRTWFDVAGNDIYKRRVQEVFRNMYAAVKDENVRIRIDNTHPNWYAYVIPANPRPLTIYICNAFFSGMGGDIKARFLNSSDATVVTMLHECTHIPWVAGTDDHRYGKIPCRALAFSDPNLAVNNADNYAFYSLSLIQAF